VPPRPRLAAELGIQRSGDVEMTAAGVLELAWMMGLLTWHDTPKSGWYDASGALVPEEEVYERYRDEVVARCGIREFVDDGVIAPDAEEDVAVSLVLSVLPARAERLFVGEDPDADGSAPRALRRGGGAGGGGEWGVGLAAPGGGRRVVSG